LTNWCQTPIRLIPGEDAAGDGTILALDVPNTANGLGLTPQNYLFASGMGPFDAGGLTNLSASQLTGTLPTKILPGVTTNISTAGFTLHITNGLIMQVTSP
jgi:hypothetical protein